MIYQSPATNGAASDLSIRCADIRKRNGRWMVSHNLKTEESVLIQFPPLMEDEDHERSERAAYVGSGGTATKYKTTKKHDKKHKQEGRNECLKIGGSLDLTTATETDSHKEWFPL